MIYAKNICLSLGRNVILDDVSFSIEAGQYVGLIGPNGAGKTSLIKTILGLYKPTSGSVEMTPGNRIGYVPQSYSLSSVVPISVFEVLRMSGIKDKKLLEKNLLKVGLQAEFLQQNFHQLSGGQKQRVIIARSLCQEPNLIIFDEPLNGVDFETKIKIYDLLAQLNRSENVTILFVSHEVDHIFDRCHHILCLNKTMHTGCHPLDFAKGNHTQCPILATAPKIVPIHHHHHDQSSACC
jgi:zinc transport system ATP-binding protein